MADFGKIPKGERFGLIPAFVSRLRDLKPGPKALYASLCTNASAEGRLWRSLDRLAEEFGVSRRQIQRWLNELEAAGLLVRFTVPRKSFLVIRDPAGREWAKRTNLASVIGRRMVFAKPGRAGAVARWSGGTSASKQNDKGVAHSATPMSPKHDLPNKTNSTKEGARQEGARDAGRAPNAHTRGLRRLNTNSHGPAVQEALNRLADAIGWDSVGMLDPREIAKRLATESAGTLTEAQAFSALSVRAG